MSTEQTPDELGYSRAPLTFPIPPGAPEKPCKSCGAPMIWTVTALGKRMPLNPDGTSHFSTCENAAAHRKPKTPTRPERLTRDQVLILEAFERGEFPNTHRHASKFALADVRRWALVHPNSNALTPAGVEALAKHRRSR